MRCIIWLLSCFIFLGLQLTHYGYVIEATTTEGFKIPYRCPEAMIYCVFDGQCYSYEELCVEAETLFTTDAESTVRSEYSTTVGGVDNTLEDSSITGTTSVSDGETTTQDGKSTEFVTKFAMTSTSSEPDQTTETNDSTISEITDSDGSKHIDGSTEPNLDESTPGPETTETTQSVDDDDTKATKIKKEIPTSTVLPLPDVTTDDSSVTVSSESSQRVTSDQSASSTSTSLSSTSSTIHTSLSSSTITTSSQTSSTPMTTVLPTTLIPSSNTTVYDDVPVQTTIKTTPASSNSVILVFKGHLANPYHFNATLLFDLSTMLNRSMEIPPSPFILKLDQFGPKNSTVTTEVSAVQFYTDENFRTVSRVVPSTEILTALSDNTTSGWKIADLEFVCGYPSKDKPCVTLPLPYKPRVVTSGDLFENNKDLFIAIFVLASLFLLIIILGLIYLRCRQRRSSSYETNNVKLEKAKLTSATEVNPEINSPLSDKEILKGEMETSLSQNGAPPLDKDAGWIIPLDQILDNRKNSSSADTKL